MLTAKFLQCSKINATFDEQLNVVFVFVIQDIIFKKKLNVMIFLNSIEQTRNC